MVAWRRSGAGQEARVPRRAANSRRYATAGRATFLRVFCDCAARNHHRRHSWRSRAFCALESMPARRLCKLRDAATCPEPVAHFEACRSRSSVFDNLLVQIGHARFEAVSIDRSRRTSQLIGKGRRINRRRSLSSSDGWSQVGDAF